MLEPFKVRILVSYSHTLHAPPPQEDNLNKCKQRHNQNHILPLRHRKQAEKRHRHDIIHRNNTQSLLQTPSLSQCIDRAHGAYRRHQPRDAPHPSLERLLDVVLIIISEPTVLARCDECIIPRDSPVKGVAQFRREDVAGSARAHGYETVFDMAVGVGPGAVDPLVAAPGGMRQGFACEEKLEVFQVG